MRAARTHLERVRRVAVRLGLAELGEPAYDVGALVWVRFGATGGLQLARIRFADPVSFDGSPRHWWWVDVFWPTRGRWISSHRRVLRALTPPELVALSTVGVERNGA